MAVSGAWTYTLAGTDATITDYSTAIGGFTPTIPTTLDGNDVIAIASNAMGIKGLTSVTFNHTVDLQGRALQANAGIAVNVNADLTTSGITSTSFPFRNCAIGSGKVTISEGVTSLPDSLFYNSGVSGSITFPSTLQTIGEDCFFFCSITSINIPDSLTLIKRIAFQNNSISTLTFNSDITLGDNCFKDNNNLTLEINADITTGLVNVIDSPFYGCDLANNVTIGEGVTLIDSVLFAVSGLTEISFPESMIDINNDALYGNSNLTSITFNAKETISFGADVLDQSQPSPKGDIYGYDTSVQTWASGESIPTYYNFTLLVSTTSDYLIEINDIDYTDKADMKTIRWTNFENFSNTADGFFIDDTNFIEMGMELIIRRKIDSKIVFGGLIQQPKKVLLSPNFMGVKVHAESYKQILGRRTFELNVQNQLSGTTVQGIFDDFLKAGGAITDEELTLGNIDTGILIESYVKRAQSGLKLFNDLADASDYKWWITNEKAFYFQSTPTYIDNTTTKKLTPNKSDPAYIKCIDLPDFSEDSSKFRTRQNVIGKKIDGVFVFGSYTDTTAETEMATRYGSGVFGSVMVNDNISTTAEANSLAQSEVETYVNPAKIRFKTTDFFEPLELIKVDISILGISNETYKVTKVSYALDNDTRIVCDVTCESYQLANKPKRTWTDEFNEMVKENAKQGNEDDYSYNDNVGIVNLAPAVPYLNTITHILDKDRALHCHYSIVGVSAGAGTVTVTFDINTVVQKTFTFDIIAGNFAKTFSYPIRGIATSGSATVDASTTSTAAVAIAINDLNFWVNNE